MPSSSRPARGATRSGRCCGSSARRGLFSARRPRGRARSSAARASGRACGSRARSSSGQAAARRSSSATSQDSGTDVPVLTDELSRYRKDGIGLRILPLYPNDEALGLFAGLLPASAFVSDTSLEKNAGNAERQSVVASFPVWLVLLEALLLVGLAANEYAGEKPALEDGVSRARIAVHVSGAVALVLLAGVLALLGRDVLAWRGQTEGNRCGDRALSRRPRGRAGNVAARRLCRERCSPPSDDVSVARALQGVQRLRCHGRSGPLDPARAPSSRSSSSRSTRSPTAPARPRSAPRARQLHALLLFQQLVLQAGSGSASAALDRTIVGVRRRAVRAQSGERGEASVRPRDAAPDLQADRHRARRRARVPAHEPREGSAPPAEAPARRRDGRVLRCA